MLRSNKSLVQPSRYRIWGLVGRGQFGKVYVARDRFTNQIVALKQLDQKLPTHKFLRELRFLLSLNHENIVAYIALEHYRQSRFLVMEYCEAGTLRDAIAYGHRLSYGQVIQIMLDLLEGLAYVHQSQIVHCDLKPENILLKLTAKGYLAKISDFGVARLIGEPNREDSQNSGSPGYMAPERFYGQFSVASDIYAIGIILYELLLDRRPFSGMPKELMFAHLNQRVKIPASLPLPLADILLKALQKLPNKRFYSALEMQQSLSQLLASWQEQSDQICDQLVQAFETVEIETIAIDRAWQIHTTSPIKAICAVSEKLIYASQNQIWQRSLGSIPIKLKNSTGAQIIEIKSLANQFLYRSRNQVCVSDSQFQHIEVLYQSEHSFHFALLPEQRWFAVASGNKMQIHSLITSQKIKVDFPYRQVQGLVAINSNHFGLITLEQETYQSKLLVVARKGQIIWKLPISEPIAQICQSYIPNQVVLVTANQPYSLLFINLNPYRVRRYLCDLAIDLLVPTPWGFLASSPVNNYQDINKNGNQSLVTILDDHGQTLGKLLFDGIITAMTTIEAHLVAIAVQVSCDYDHSSCQSSSTSLGQLYLVDLKKINVDLIF